MQRVYKITAYGPVSVVRQESGLSDAESEALHDEAYRLMVDARVLTSRVMPAVHWVEQEVLHTPKASNAFTF